MLNVFSAIEYHVLGTPLPSLQRCTALLHFERLTDLMCFHTYLPTVRDTENFTFFEEFCGCSARTPADSSAERRRSSAERPRIFCVGDTNFPQIRAKNGGNQKANFVRNNNARIKKDSTRIVRVIIVGLDSLSPSSAPVESG